jgi:histone deacetylase complex subunit SAP30
VDILLAYRAQNMLDTPTSFRSIETQAVLNNPGIGRHSPSMIRKRPKRYVSKDLLATAVRKHFNAVAVNEQEVVLDFLYTVKNQGRFVKHPGLAGMAEGAPQRNFFKRFGIVLKNPEDRD